jgi:hypothetical protein
MAQVDLGFLDLMCEDGGSEDNHGGGYGFWYWGYILWRRRR